MIHREATSGCLGNTVQLNGDLNTRIRRIRTDIGFIFQQFNLVGRLTLLTNVMTGMLSRIPMWRSLLGWFTREEKEMAMQALAQVGMAEYAGQRASTLSGGQQQRAAIARAMVQQSKIIFADEPIASLDPESSRKVMRSLRKINQDHGITVLVSLHQVDFAMQFCKRCIGLRDGRVVYDGPTSALDVGLLQELYGAEFSDVEEGIDIYTQVAGRRPKNEMPEEAVVAGLHVHVGLGQGVMPFILKPLELHPTRGEENETIQRKNNPDGRVDGHGRFDGHGEC